MRFLVLFSALLGLAVAQSGLIIEVTKAAQCDRKSRIGDLIFVHYKGTFLNGTQFDSSYGEEPFGFTLGVGDVIDGFDLGLADMCIGEKRKITIPPELGYGNRAVGPIPPNSTLVFEVEMMSIQGVGE